MKDVWHGQTKRVEAAETKMELTLIKIVQIKFYTAWDTDVGIYASKKLFTDARR